MAIWDRFTSTDEKQSLDDAYVRGDISLEQYEKALDRKIEAEVTKQQKIAEHRQKASRSLQAGRPSTHAEEGSRQNRNYYTSQDLGNKELRKIKEMRESGGDVAEWVHARALLTFASGSEFTGDDENLVDYLNDTFGHLGLLLSDLGEDAIWYPRAFGEIVETRGGDFSHIKAVEPWTMDYETDQTGEVTQWIQEIDNQVVNTFEPDEIGYFVLKKSSARDETGISQVWCGKEDIERYIDAKRSVDATLKSAGYGNRHWKVGEEGMSIIDDNSLRRVRNIVQRAEPGDDVVTGVDVEADKLEPVTFDFETLLTFYAREAAAAVGVPFEIATVISEGLGSGEQSGLRLQWFKMQMQADQLRLGRQFIEQIARPVAIEYGGFSEEAFEAANVSLNWEPVFDDLSEMLDVVNAVGDEMTVDEKREMLDLGPVPEEAEAEGDSFVPAKEQEEPESEGPDLPGMFEEPIEQEVENQLDQKVLGDGSGNCNCGLELSQADDVPLEAYPEWERALIEFHDRAFTADSDRNLLEFSGSDTPQFVFNRIREAILSGALFGQIDAIDSSQRMQLQEVFLEEMQSDAFTIDGMANAIETSLDVDADRAETIARTEAGEFSKLAREIGYEERGEVDGEEFYWVGDLGDRTTDVCKYLIAGFNADLENPGQFQGLRRPEGTNPFEGGSPMELEELKEHMQEVAKAAGHNPRNWTPHINCRKDFVRHVE